MTMDITPDTDTELVRYDVRDGVAVISWNRPHRNNAWTPALEDAYFTQLRVAAADDEVKAIVITGRGRHFSPGMDMQHLASASNGVHNRPPEEREPQTLPMTIPKPIIAAIHGSCAGTGFIQACVADVRFVAPDAKLTAAFVRRGIMAEHGLAVLLPAIVGTANALDILMSGRVLSGTEAAGLGFAKLAAPGRAVDEAVAYARDIAATCSPVALAITKKQVYEGISEPLESARRDALDIWKKLREHGDFKEGVASFVERRAPRFAPLDEQWVRIANTTS
ncbi:enoyl-CoA hydratase-related protein [Nocardia jinanensis]|uniref:Enoyl-CoA hydratase n=1 Tax=Nocardia jinanensis TaxID=382504 RepID=A0A917RKS7_9NOCA|nr:enoyl-CoA hydratase-related protein [Nocardia jinanensis]GGL12698.1 enoyl-CoA hydratase [Nocardia jinanensis]